MKLIVYVIKYSTKFIFYLNAFALFTSTTVLWNFNCENLNVKDSNVRSSNVKSANVRSSYVTGSSVQMTTNDLVNFNCYEQ